MFTKDEKEYLALLVKRDLEHFKREKIGIDVPIPFLDTEEKYQKFVENVLKKIQHGKE